MKVVNVILQGISERFKGVLLLKIIHLFTNNLFSKSEIPCMKEEIVSEKNKNNSPKMRRNKDNPCLIDVSHAIFIAEEIELS